MQECGFICSDACVATCGDGYKASNEQCDDENVFNADGCSENCEIEPGFKCVSSATHGRCGADQCDEVPGDGLTVGGEACDDGNFEDGDGCDSFFQLECGFVQMESFLGTLCGDGLWAGAEECDDGNTRNDDGCSSECSVELGWACDGRTCGQDACSPICGDGRVILGSEDCDDGNRWPGDGCSEECISEAPVVCGDDLWAGPEECDDGNLEAGDGCSSVCKLEEGFRCFSKCGGQDVCASICGDGRRVAEEQCDDGNDVEGDGCTSCVIDPYHVCVYGSTISADLCTQGVPIFDCAQLYLKPVADETEMFGLLIEFPLQSYSQPSDEIVVEYLRVESECGSGDDSEYGSGGSNTPEIMFSDTINGDSTSHLVENVDQGSWYTARVRGSNAFGDGPWCESSWKVKIVSTSKPPEVLNTSLTPDSDGHEQVCISWSLEDSESSCEYYSISTDWSDNDSPGQSDPNLLNKLEISQGKKPGINPEILELDQSLSKYCLGQNDGIIPGSIWSFRLQACNRAGCSSMSDSPALTVEVPNRIRVEYLSATQGDKAKMTKVSIALAGIPGGVKGPPISISKESAKVASLDKNTIMSTSSFEGFVSLDLSLGPSTAAGTVKILIQVGDLSASFDFTFYDSSIARLVSASPLQAVNKGPTGVMRIIMSGLIFDDPTDLTMLFDGVKASLAVTVSSDQSQTFIEAAIPPKPGAVGPVEVVLLSVNGLEQVISKSFEYLAPCDTTTFCRSQPGSYIANPAKAGNVGYNCDMSYCINPYTHAALAVTNIMTIPLTAGGSDGRFEVNLTVQNLISDASFSLSIGDTIVKATLDQWENDVVISFRTPIPSSLPCNQCGIMCQCWLTGTLEERLGEFGRAATFRFEYVIPIHGPPVVVVFSGDDGVVAGRQYTFLAEIQNIPAMLSANLLVLALDDARKGTITNARISSSNRRSTKLYFDFLAPATAPLGPAYLSVSHRGIVDASMHARISLNLIAAKHPRIVSTFPNILSVNNSAIQCIIHDWLAFHRVMSARLIGCGHSIPGTYSIDLKQDDSATISADFGTGLSQCVYNLRVEVSAGEPATSFALNVTTHVSSSPLVSLSTSKGSVAGGDRIFMEIKNFAVISTAEDFEIFFVGGGADDTSLATGITLISSTIISTHVSFFTPPAKYPGQVEAIARHSESVVAARCDFQYTIIPAMAVPSLSVTSGGSKVTIIIYSFPESFTSIRAIMHSYSSKALSSTKARSVDNILQFDVELPPFYSTGLYTLSLDLIVSPSSSGGFPVSCVTTGGPATMGTPCSFPFTFQGQEYSKCTNINNGANGGMPWCSTQYEYLGAQAGWGICECGAKQSVTVEYFNPPSIRLVTQSEDEVVTVKLFDFEPLAVSTDARVLFGTQPAQIEAVLAEDTLKVRLPRSVEQVVDVQVIPTGPMHESTRVQKTATFSSFRYPASVPKIISCSPNLANVRSSDQVSVVLSNFPQASEISDDIFTVSFSGKGVEKQATGLQMIYSDSESSMLQFDLPDIKEAGRYALTVAFGASASARRPFTFFDSRVSITCINTDSMLEGCHGSMQGGNLLKVTIYNFGKITHPEQLEIFFGERISHVVSIASSSMEVTHFTVRVPPVIGQKKDFPIDLNISNLETFSVMMLASAVTEFTYLAVPHLKEARFEQDGGSIIITFDSITNGERLGKLQTPCSNLLSSECMLKLGDAPTCIWISAAKLRVSMDASATIMINDLLEIRPASLKHVSGLGPYVKGKARLQAPLISSPATLSIIGPQQVGPCDDIEVQATISSASRPFTFLWECRTCNCRTLESKTAALCKKLSTTTASVLRLDSSDLAVANMQYEIAVTGNNFMGISSKPASLTIFKSMMPIPIVSFVVMPSYSSSNAILIKAKADFSSCHGAEKGELRFAWRQSAQGDHTDGVVPLEYLSRDSSSLWIPGRTLPVGPYTFAVTVTLDEQVVDLQVSTRVVASELVAVILGGDTVIPASSLATFSLDGQRSYDPDLLAEGVMNYKWTCTEDGMPCRDRMTNNILHHGAAVWTISPSVLSKTVNTQYEFLLTVSKGLRTATALTRVSVGDGDFPATAISCASTVFKDGVHYLNPSDTLILRESKCATCSKFSWSIDQIETGSTSRILIVEAGSLVEGRTYEFTVKASMTDAVGPFSYGSSSYFVTVNRRPSGGTCRVTLADSALVESAGENLAPVLLQAKNMVTGDQLAGATYEIYSDFDPESYSGCAGDACGTSVASTMTSLDGMGHGQVPAGDTYLVVSRLIGFYNGYALSYVQSVGARVSVDMVAEMADKQERVVLRWDHDQDLDLWVFDAADTNVYVGWEMGETADERTASVLGGTVTLDVDNQGGLEGPETTQFNSMVSGVVQIWINHYDDAFSADQVAATPATVDIYCHSCLDDQGDTKQGLVTSITQEVGNVVAGTTWWKVSLSPTHELVRACPHTHSYSLSVKNRAHK